MIKWLLVAALPVTTLGCLHDDRPTREENIGAIIGSTNRAPVIPAPKADRCSNLGKSGLRSQCEDAKYLAHNYVRHLAMTDEICVEGGFGDNPTGACLARGWIADASPDRVLVEIRGPKPESRWFKYSESQVWFEEGALVDLYLAERGY